MIGWLLLQLVPLPRSLWQALPGRELVAAIDQGAGLGTIRRPMSLVPNATWNALLAFLVPLGVLALGSQLDGRGDALPRPIGDSARLYRAAVAGSGDRSSRVDSIGSTTLGAGDTCPTCVIGSLIKVNGKMLRDASS